MGVFDYEMFRFVLCIAVLIAVPVAAEFLFSKAVKRSKNRLAQTKLRRLFRADDDGVDYNQGE